MTLEELEKLDIKDFKKLMANKTNEVVEEQRRKEKERYADTTPISLESMKQLTDLIIQENKLIKRIYGKFSIYQDHFWDSILCELESIKSSIYKNKEPIITMGQFNRLSDVVDKLNVFYGAEDLLETDIDADGNRIHDDVIRVKELRDALKEEANKQIHEQTINEEKALEESKLQEDAKKHEELIKQIEQEESEIDFE